MVKDNNSEDFPKKARFSVALPLDVSIRMEIDRSKTKLTKVEWIEEAVLGKIEKNEKHDSLLEKIKDELKEIKELLKKKDH